VKVLLSGIILISRITTSCIIKLEDGEGFMFQACLGGFGNMPSKLTTSVLIVVTLNRLLTMTVSGPSENRDSGSHSTSHSFFGWFVRLDGVEPFSFSQIEHKGNSQVSNIGCDLKRRWIPIVSKECLRQ